MATVARVVFMMSLSSLASADVDVSTACTSSATCGGGMDLEGEDSLASSSFMQTARVRGVQESHKRSSFWHLHDIAMWDTEYATVDGDGIMTAVDADGSNGKPGATSKYPLKSISFQGLSTDKHSTVRFDRASVGFFPGGRLHLGTNDPNTWTTDDVFTLQWVDRDLPSQELTPSGRPSSAFGKNWDVAVLKNGEQIHRYGHHQEPDKHAKVNLKEIGNAVKFVDYVLDLPGSSEDEKVALKEQVADMYVPMWNVLGSSTEASSQGDSVTVFTATEDGNDNNRFTSKYPLSSLSVKGVNDDKQARAGFGRAGSVGFFHTRLHLGTNPPNTWTRDDVFTMKFVNRSLPSQELTPSGRPSSAFGKMWDVAILKNGEEIERFGSHQIPDQHATMSLRDAGAAIQVVRAIPDISLFSDEEKAAFEAAFMEAMGNDALTEPLKHACGDETINLQEELAGVDEVELTLP